MKRFEYKSGWCETGVNAIIYLNKLGSYGWELVYMDKVIQRNKDGKMPSDTKDIVWILDVIFKREV